MTTEDLTYLLCMIRGEFDDILLSHRVLPLQRRLLHQSSQCGHPNILYWKESVCLISSHS